MAASSPPSSPASTAGRLRVPPARAGHWLAAGSGGRARRSDAKAPPGRALPTLQRLAPRATARAPDETEEDGLGCPWKLSSSAPGTPFVLLRDAAECALDGVMVLQVQVMTQRRHLRAVVCSPAYIRWRTGDSRKHALVQRGWLPRRPSQGH